MRDTGNGDRTASFWRLAGGRLLQMQNPQERGVCQPEKSALTHLPLSILPVLKGPGQPHGWRAAYGHPGKFYLKPRFRNVFLKEVSSLSRWPDI